MYSHFSFGNKKAESLSQKIELFAMLFGWT